MKIVLFGGGNQKEGNLRCLRPEAVPEKKI